MQKVGKEEREQVVGKCGVSVVNKIGESLIKMWLESYDGFKKLIYKCTWAQENGDEIIFVCLCFSRNCMDKIFERCYGEVGTTA